MKGFILAALPWVLIGLSFAILFSKHLAKNKNNKKTCESEGIAIGMCMGAGLGTMFEGGLALGVSIGVLLGLYIGSRIPKKDNNDEQHNKE